MTITFADDTKNPVIIAAGTTATPFSAISVSDSVLSDPETITVSLSGYPPGNIGTLSDPAGGSFDAKQKPSCPRGG
jgi:hypothetical protein